eukprot:TRINITY_DN4974_c0_g2_i1.p1 TRINITY_DN4974_c0_g2~~TRINITY_DN4974_c0_g2_i1.p1  ORF type:complete len:209 (-),score=28.84 TRINITY_DN4974_c0_g2_i1:62-688(-)
MRGILILVLLVALVQSEMINVPVLKIWSGKSCVGSSVQLMFPGEYCFYDFPSGLWAKYSCVENSVKFFSDSNCSNLVDQMKNLNICGDPFNLGNGTNPVSTTVECTPVDSSYTLTELVFGSQSDCTTNNLNKLIDFKFLVDGHCVFDPAGGPSLMLDVKNGTLSDYSDPFCKNLVYVSPLGSIINQCNSVFGLSIQFCTGPSTGCYTP